MYIVFCKSVFFVSFNKLVKRAVIICYDYSTIAGAHESISEYLKDHKNTLSRKKKIQFQHKRLFAVLYYKYTPISFGIYSNSLTMRFFFKFVSLNSKTYRRNEFPKKHKMQALNFFRVKPPSNLAAFQQKRSQMPGRPAVSTLHQTRNDTLSFFKFLHNKVSRLDKKSFCTFLCNSMDYNLEKLCSKTSRCIK